MSDSDGSRSASSAEQTLERFAHLLDVHGAQLAAWPEAEREFGHEVLAADQRARELRVEALALSEWLDADPSIEPSPTLQRRVAEIPLRHPQRAVSWLPRWAQLWAPAFAGVMLVALGMFSGWATQTPVAEAEDVEDWDDISALALADDIGEGWE